MSYSNVYQLADARLSSGAGGEVGTTVLWQPAPVHLGESAVQRRRERLATLCEFFDRCLDIFRASLAGELHPNVLDFLLNDTPSHLREDYHVSLPPEVYRRPVFYRTDESANGAIFELQAPGSGWGDLQLMRDVYDELAPNSAALSGFSPAAAFSAEVVAYVDDPSPTVFHMLDNASAPAPMRLHIRSTQPPLRYWGWDASVRYGECKFIRTHSFFSLTTENYFQLRLRAAAEGTVLFDLPPLVLFDQKAPLALPFWEPTRDFFSDAVRDILAYTTPVTEDGVMLETGERISLQQFSQRPERLRRYYLKYAGSDVGRNWGSRSVFRLHGSDCERLLDAAAADGRRGAYWVLQPERSIKDSYAYVDESGSVVSARGTSKLSCFYGPFALIGIKTMHRNHFKVHGQSDTTIGLGLA